MRNRVNVCFHGIGTPQRELEDGEARYWIPEDTFHRIADDLVGRDVAISFDDGNLSDLEIGLPALQQRGLTATFFVLAGRLDDPGSLQPEHVKALADAGMTIGTHGMRHIPWRGLDDATQHAELVEARDRLRAAAGTPVDDAALPLGRYDRRLISALRRQGYRTVFTSDRRWARPDAWLQPRFSARSEDTPESFRRDVLTPQPLPTHVKGELKSLAKRLR
jgi:peptidoglycan/xylan/chitin deacetylase (PgdA/CDA1 family)